MITLTNYRIATRENLPNQWSISNTQPKWWHGSGLIPELIPGQLVWDLKSGKISQAEYTKSYMGKLEDLDQNGFNWDSLEGKTLLCWCQEGAFCHRRLLAAFLTSKFKVVTLR